MLFPLLEAIEKCPTVPPSPLPLDAVLKETKGETSNPMSPDEEWVVVKRSSYDGEFFLILVFAVFLTLGYYDSVDIRQIRHSVLK